jgi:hypothetical protein
MARYRVTEGTQVHHAGVTYAGGETFTVDEPATPEVHDAVAMWLNGGWVTEVEDAKPKARRRS